MGTPTNIAIGISLILISVAIIMYNEEFKAGTQTGSAGVALSGAFLLLILFGTCSFQKKICKGDVKNEKYKGLEDKRVRNEKRMKTYNNGEEVLA